MQTTDTLDTLADVDAAHEEYGRYVPAYLVCGIECGVEHEDHEYEEIESWHREIAADLAYAVRMSL